MGTRGFVGYILPDGQVRGSYNHFDSYPSCLGITLQREIQSLLDGKTDGAAATAVVMTTTANLLSQVQALTWVDATADCPPETLEKLLEKGSANTTVSTGIDWYSALRANQGSWLKPLSLGYATADHGFLQDSLFCEWGYVLDFRSSEIVILRGFNEDAEKQAAYCRAKPLRDGRPGDKYVGCRELWRGSLPAFAGLDMNALEADD